MIFNDNNTVVGWIESCVGLHSYSIRINSNSNTVDINSLKVDNELEKVLESIKDKEWFRKRLSESTNAGSFASRFQSIVNDIDFSNVYTTNNKSNSNTNSNNNVILPSSSSSSSSLPQIVMDHLEQLGWENFISINNDFNTLTLLYVDSSKRPHTYDVIISNGYPQKCPKISIAIPGGTVSIPLWSQRSNLLTVKEAVIKQINRFNEYFSIMSDLDSNCWVLEPATPSFAIVTRRIVIDRSCSVIVTIDPDNPTTLCDMKFLGPPDKVKELVLLLGSNANKWDNKKSTKLNLEMVLCVTLPTKSDHHNEDFLIECGICYTNSLEVKSTTSSTSSFCTPDQVCPKVSCNRMYHFTCLVDWMQSIPTCRSSFGTLFGTCPYCQEPMSVRILK